MIPAELRPDSNPDPGIRAPDHVALPISEIIGGERRLDAEAYLSDGFAIRRQIRHSNLQVFSLGELAKIWRPSESRKKLIPVAREYGIPYISATQVFDIWPTPRKWIAPSKTPHLAERYVKPGWILVTCSGTVGNVMIAYAAQADLVVSADLLRVEIDDPKLRSYVYVFLRSHFGGAMTRSSQFGSVVKHLEVDHLAETPIPILDRLVDELDAATDLTFRMRDEAYRLDMKSRSTFAEALNDRPSVPCEQGYIVSASYLFSGRRRLEAYAHSPDSRWVSTVYERNSESIVALGEIAQVHARGRFARIYGETGTAYLDSEPIFKINPELNKFLTPATDINFDAYLVRRGWLLMACSGQTYGINGQAILANEWHEGKVVTQHILRIIPNPEKVRSGYLQTLLLHPELGRPLVVSRAYGTSVPELAPEDIEQLPIPRLAPQIEDEIADAAERASELRRKADEIENGAVFRFEDELERELGILSDRKQRDQRLFCSSA